jgi:hypothetical protein
MDIIWQTQAGRETDFDREYIQDVVLLEVMGNHKFDFGSHKVPCSDGVIIYSTHDASISSQFRSYLKENKNYSLVQLCLERLVHDTSYYNLAQNVIRTYYDPRIINKNVYFIPVGFQSGFHNNDLEHTTLAPRIKDNVWCFVGQLKSHRRRMVRAFADIEPNFTYYTTQWADPNALTPNQMRDLYRRTIFVPCPFGNRNPDSYRIMEALEYGCIPIVLTFLGEDYFRYVFGNHPFLVAESWENARDQVRELLSNQEKLRVRQQQTLDWYIKFKNDLACDIRTLLTDRSQSKKLISSQFLYQREPKRWIILRLYDLYYGHGIHRRLFRWFVNL